MMTINSVRTFQISQNRLVVSTEDELLLFDGLELVRRMPLLKPWELLAFDGNNIIILTHDPKTISKVLNWEMVESFQLTDLILWEIRDGLLYTTHIKEDSTKILNMSDRREMDTYTLMSYETPYLWNGYIVGAELQRMNRTIFGFKLGESAQINWRYIIPESYDRISYDNSKVPARVLVVLGIYQGLFWIVLTTGCFLALDIETGKEVHSFWKSVNISNARFENPNETNNGNTASILDAEKGVIYGLAAYFYWEIDLNTEDPSKHFIVYSWKEESDRLKIYNGTINGIHTVGDYLFFFQNTREKRIGVFSRSQRKPVWVGEIDALNYGILKIRYYQGHLLLLDQTKTLHIIKSEIIP